MTTTHERSDLQTLSSLDPLYRYDTHFPERISRPTFTVNTEYPESGGEGTSSGHGKAIKRRNRAAARFKTQPITFDEIKEVDEESPTPTEEPPSMEGLKTQFAAFSKSMDVLVSNLPVDRQKSSAALHKLETVPSASDPDVTQDDNANGSDEHQKDALLQDIRQRRKKKNLKAQKREQLQSQESSLQEEKKS